MVIEDNPIDGSAPVVHGPVPDKSATFCWSVRPFSLRRSDKEDGTRR